MINIIKNKNTYNVYKNEQLLAKSKVKIKLYNKIIKCAHMLLTVRHKKNKMNIYGLFLLKDKHKIMKNKIFIKTNGIEYRLKYLIKLKFLSMITILYKTEIPYNDFEQAKIHNRLVVIYKEENGFGFYKRMKWNFLYNNNSKFNSSSVKMIKEINTAIYLRQSSNNSLFITTRVINDTDYFKEQVKINLAYFVSKILKRDVVLMYEKDANKYEESASVLYEQLIDENMPNVYYVLNKDSKHNELVKDKYRKNIVLKNSFKNYLYFFWAKSFIGTEAAAHSVNLRVKNKFIEQKLFYKKYNYVFLQHGVMYMVSLASKTRVAFRKGNLMPTTSKIVVSSKLEAEHFIKDGNYDSDDLYITGLPKFDRTYRNDTADKIIIMPTWRPWEYNQIRTDVKNTNYYKMLLEIVENIPNNLKDKIIVLPHPLFIELVEDDFPIKLPNYTSYDELLRECEILITDYSSIAFDAFYRGSNVIFWWKEKEECMKQYEGHLMLNENNVFGDICNNGKELMNVVSKRYKQKQLKKYSKNYEKIVEFTDSFNTERLIEKLKQDNLI